MWTTLIIVFICSYLAFSLSAICGGGAGLILIPILGRLLPVSQVPAALSIGTFTSSGSRIIVFYRSIAWHIVKWFVPAALPAVWLGAWLLKFINPLYLELFMGLFLVSNLPFIFKKPKELEVRSHPSNWVLMGIGFLAGFLSGLTGAVGLLFNKFYLRYGLTKEQIIATRAANEICMHLIKIVLYTLFGLISSKVLLVGAVVAFSGLLSTWTMKWVLPRLSEFLFKKIGYFAMVASGFAILFQSGGDLLTANRGSVSFGPLADGLETKLRWQNANYALEFAYDEGFGFEQVIPFKELTLAQQHTVLAQKNGADKIVIEAVYNIGSSSFEAYYFKDGKYVNQVDFE